jgi:hypothetical protein
MSQYSLLNIWKCSLTTFSPKSRQTLTKLSRWLSVTTFLLQILVFSSSLFSYFLLKNIWLVQSPSPVLWLWQIAQLDVPDRGGTKSQIAEIVCVFWWSVFACRPFISPYLFTLSYIIKGNVLNFSLGEGVKFALPNVFWTRFQAKYGTVCFVSLLKLGQTDGIF